MKYIFLNIFLCLIALNSLAQFNSREAELIEIEQSQDTLPRTIFLDSTEFPNLKMIFVTNSRQVWRSTYQEILNIEQFYDIRIKFDSKEKAFAYHNEYWKENSEFGPEIKKHNIKTNGTEKFRVFHGTELINKMVGVYGRQMFCYIFIIDNYYIKFYIDCKKDLKPEIIQPFLDSVIKRIKEQTY
jgi:hypothetical protein